MQYAVHEGHLRGSHHLGPHISGGRGLYFGIPTLLRCYRFSQVDPFLRQAKELLRDRQRESNL